MHISSISIEDLEQEFGTLGLKNVLYNMAAQLNDDEDNEHIVEGFLCFCPGEGYYFIHINPIVGFLVEKNVRLSFEEPTIDEAVCHFYTVVMLCSSTVTELV